MTNIEAYDKIIYYLKSHFIKFHENVNGNAKQLTIVYTGYLNCPNCIIESSIYFDVNCMECRVYYTELGSFICKNSFNKVDLYRLLNYINATIWPCTYDGCNGSLYQPTHLYTPRIHVTEDECYDITATTIIHYDFFELAPLETADYMTASIPDLMNKLSPAIFGILKGKMSIEQAITYLDSYVLI